MFHTRDLGNFRVENRFCIAGSVPTFRLSNFFFFFFIRQLVPKIWIFRNSPLLLSNQEREKNYCSHICESVDIPHANTLSILERIYIRS